MKIFKNIRVHQLLEDKIKDYLIEKPPNCRICYNNSLHNFLPTDNELNYFNLENNNKKLCVKPENEDEETRPNWDIYFTNTISPFSKSSTLKFKVKGVTSSISVGVVDESYSSENTP